MKRGAKFNAIQHAVKALTYEQRVEFLVEVAESDVRLSYSKGPERAVSTYMLAAVFEGCIPFSRKRGVKELLEQRSPIRFVYKIGDEKNGKRNIWAPLDETKHHLLENKLNILYDGKPEPVEEPSADKSDLIIEMQKKINAIYDMMSRLVREWEGGAE